jgi:trehalose 6-phosphate synthase
MATLSHGMKQSRPRELAIVTRRSPEQHWNGQPNGLSALLSPLCSTDFYSWFFVNETDDGLSRHDVDWFEHFYSNYCNAYLWPLLHGTASLIAPSRQDERAYELVNEHVARDLIERHGTDKPVWVHDFHFFPFAVEARSKGFTGRMGFYHHAPVASSRTVEVDPALSRWYRHLVAYNHIGVQTLRDAEELDAILRTTLKSETFPPITVRPVAPRLLGRHSCTHTCRHARTRSAPSEEFLFLTAGRSDPIKGHDRVIQAFGEFVERASPYQTRLQVLVSPSRQESPGYSTVMRGIEEATERSNNRALTSPVLLCTEMIPQPQFQCALANADCLVLLPRRDGMNLIAKEYVMLRGPDRPGTLILSAGTGAAMELTDAIIVDETPSDHDVDAFRVALTMSDDERNERWERLSRTVGRRDTDAWIDECLRDLAGDEITRPIPPGSA